MPRVNVKEMLTEIGAEDYPRFIKLLEFNTPDGDLNKFITVEEGENAPFYFLTVLELYKKIPTSKYREAMDASDGAFVCTTPAFSALVGWVNNGRPTTSLLEIPVFSSAALREEQKKTSMLTSAVAELKSEVAELRDQMKILFERLSAAQTEPSAQPPALRPGFFS